MSVHPRRGLRAPVVGLATLVLLLTVLVQSVAAAPPRDPRILDGQPADFGEYPFMVALLYEPIEGNDFQKQYCGASLIDRFWVLTAAHCVDFLTDPTEVAVAVGRTDLDNGAQGQRVDVAEIYIHPDWDAAVFSPDVALLRLQEPVDGITPISLAGPADDRFEAEGTLLTVIGWGNLDMRPNHAAFPNDLRELTVPIVSDATCLHAYKRSLTPDTQVCGGEKRVDSCQGDSGGPLFATEAGRRIQVGIVSWGFKCGKQHFAGVYTEVNSPTIWNFITTTMAGS